MQVPSNVDVCIVGGGPAGLMTGCALRRNGVNAVILEASAEPSTTSRATVLHARTLEVLETLEVTDEIMRRGRRLSGWNLATKSKVLCELDFGDLNNKYNCFVTLPQFHTESVLREKFAEFGGTIYWNTRVTGVTDSGDKVQLEISTPETKSTVQTSYAVASDGIHSTLRDALHIEFEGGEYTQSFVGADCTLASEGELEHDKLQLFLDPGFLLFVPLPGGVWRLLATLEQAPKEQDLALWQGIVDERAVPGVKIEGFTWHGRFHIHHRLAHNYRKGRVFLAGDAAHVHSPAGGQGMNTGIQDGYKLAEILTEAVKGGKTSAAALDRYEAARRPVAKKVVQLTHNITVSATITNRLVVTARNYILSWLMWFSWPRYYLVHRLSELEH
ncbi:hypothetical protein BAUCODRAFT_25908 [Baudoinia panamericana UAMH 10762]|uniref:FAD-binding domain-containing protein n=1 Tax=Baudoinia panamericana (strain UAMH 10762) TaxID=717646 RepID=M2N7L0_BAUPA|nr:uncharacterized protein BAUCODRAFT_25908 [Baudoinia panamericana UAMH 10762]EMC94795.1 hypothetical protein BAUCODRAFT_25908 [Baudoinia panamericana UAMH 10762]